MSGKSVRNKGVRGQSAAAKLLRDRDYTVDQKTAGLASEDIIATSPDGQAWSVEVKNTKTIVHQHLQQAMRQAAERKLPWMLMQKLAGTSSWLVRRKGENPVVWHEKAGRE